MRRVVVPNRWRYLAVIVVCIIYSFGQFLLGPKWYRAEAVLAFKNRDAEEQINTSRVTTNPLPVILDEAPVEQAYDLPSIVYSVNLANRVLGDRAEEIYNAGNYGGLTDFYEKFLSMLVYDYDGEQNVVRLSYTYKDPVLAADFCNGFARSLEDFMVEVVDRTRLSPLLRTRLETARGEAAVAEAEVQRIAEEYGVPDLIEGPKEWVLTYAQALERSYKSQAATESLLAALMQIRSNRDRQNLLSEPSPPPDTTILQDVILAGLRLRLAIVNAGIEVTSESAGPESDVRERFEQESAFLNDLIQEQYSAGIEVESRTLLMQLQAQIVKNYLYDARAETTYGRLEQLPRLEAEIRPYIRAANVANATVATLDRITALLEIGEEFGVHPITVIDSAIVPLKPILPIWNTIFHIVPTMLLLSTLWFALTTRIMDENSRSCGSDIQKQEKTD